MGGRGGREGERERGERGREGGGGERVMGWVRYSRPWFKVEGGGRSVFESVNFSI